MQLSLSTNTLALLGMLMSVCSAAPQLGGPGALPPTCIGFVDGTIKTPSCYTATTTTTVVPTTCPLIKCAAPTDPIMCPMYIKVTTTSVPCATDCCPKTPTATVTKKKCPSCTTGCVIPTITSTVTTGCKTTIGGIVTAGPSATFIVG
ncbi:hypothetical protein C8A00DRAFT_37250 [Chaetomidium leptoderma]|uniref:Uncharacterized protein n=1 Tax=Chaetomidium leptoderma TaxID=669021 RepID=A0AAN6VF52_9PEZI|nr:hypothetical protein C8A00DRAFT_37250 [Chaetomidium leptoderma]